MAPADFCPLSDRSMHYALLNDPPVRHAGKPESVYGNDRASYHDLTDLLSRAWPNGGTQAREYRVACTRLLCLQCLRSFRPSHA